MRHHALAQPSVADLKGKSLVGGIAAVSAQGAKFVVQTATMMVLARLLSPEDFWIARNGGRVDRISWAFSLPN